MTKPTHDVAAALARVAEQIRELEARYKRPAGSVKLLAVSKTKPVAAIRQAIAAGQLAFGENYPDEAMEKIHALENEHCEWHFIGAIQSRKAALLARNFSWVHSVERMKVANKLSANRPPELPPLQICLQVNIDNEASKSGVPVAELPALAEQCSSLPGLQLRGLMAIPAPREQLDEQRAAFVRVRAAFEELQLAHPQLDTLSMGMSGDLEAAIAEGATIVRVGTAIFGARDR